MEPTDEAAVRFQLWEGMPSMALGQDTLTSIDTEAEELNVPLD